MDTKTLPPWSRRDFLGRLTAVSAAGLLGPWPQIAAAEPPPETTSINIVYDEAVPVLCYGPQYVATELLKLEGFTNISYATYIDEDASDAAVLAAGNADITAAWAGDVIVTADSGGPVVALSGMHIGCTEIFAHEGVRSFRDLKGKKVALYSENSVEKLWLMMMMAYIGLDPENDIEWVIHDYTKWGDLLAAGEVDAVMIWPPDAQVLRDKNIGHVILNTTTDKPWKDYFCCVISGNRDYVQKYPVATKRALRAMLKATDLCSNSPETAAQLALDNGFPTDFDRAVQVFREIPYAQWRYYDPEDTLRFFALRMHKLGMIQRSPESIVGEIADWRFLNELKMELKA